MLSGSGNGTTRSFALTDGLVVFTLTYTGGGSCQATLLDEGGKGLTTLFNVTANLTGSTAWGASSVQYSINVAALGPWQIVADQRIPVNPQFLPLDSTGAGPKVTRSFQSTGGNATATMAYSGTTVPFIVTLLTSGGETVTTLANAPTGPFSGTQTVFLQQDVIYMVDVEGSGNWTLDLR